MGSTISRMHQRVVVVGAANLHRYVHCKAAAPPATHFVGGTCTWIKRKLMRQYVVHRRILVVHGLRAIAVVHVDVYNRDPFEAASAHRGSGDSNVVEEAEAHRPVRLGVVARRTHQRKDRSRSRHRVFGGLDGRTRPRDNATSNDSGEMNVSGSSLTDRRPAVAAIRWTCAVVVDAQQFLGSSLASA